jgi:ABC-type phosphate transport system substrate-binding protein
VKNFTEFTLPTTAILLAICLTLVSSESLGQSQLILVATGSTMLQPLYVLWGDEYQKVHPGTQLHYLPVGTSESATRILSGVGDLGGGDAPLPEQQLKEATNATMELPTVLVALRSFTICRAARRIFTSQGRCLRISTLEKRLRGATERLPS